MARFDEISHKFNISALEKTFFSVFDNDMQKKIIEQILRRLYNSGIAGDGQRLITDKHASNSYYAASTINIKSRIGEPTDRVTLNFSGQFYDDFVSKKIESGFEIMSNFQKKDGHIQKNFTALYSSKKEFEIAITELTESEEKSMLKNLKNEIVKKIIINTTK